MGALPNGAISFSLHRNLRRAFLTVGGTCLSILAFPLFRTVMNSMPALPLEVVGYRILTRVLLVPRTAKAAAFAI